MSPGDLHDTLIEGRPLRLGGVKCLEVGQNLGEEPRDRQRVLPVGRGGAARVADRALALTEELDGAAVAGERRRRFVEGRLAGKEDRVVEQLVEDHLSEGDFVVLE